MVHLTSLQTEMVGYCYQMTQYMYNRLCNPNLRSPVTYLDVAKSNQKVANTKIMETV